ncbi:hypothetical protein ABFS82_07G013400 [Erythranthe guttata]
MTSHHPTAHIIPPPPPPPPPEFSGENQKPPDIQSVRTLVTIINHHMQTILQNTESQKALTLKCTSKLKIKSQEFFEFSEHSAVSNLYWGIVNADSASQSKCPNQRSIQLDDSEKMLQVPASLDENGITMGIPNSYLLCSSYFYLSVVEFLRGDTWQVALHFLQAVSVSPGLVCGEFAPGICRSLLPLLLVDISRCDDVMVGDDDVITMRWMARRYKPWLMYYRIMSGVDDFRDMGNRGTTTNVFRRSKSLEPQNSCEHTSGFLRINTIHNNLMQPRSSQESSTNGVEDEQIASYSKKTKTKVRSNIKCLKDILTESEPESNASSVEEDVFPDQSQRIIIKKTATKKVRHKSLRIQKSSSCRTELVPLQQQQQNDEKEEEYRYTFEITKIHEILNSKSGPKYPLLKDVILDQLLIAISSSKEAKVIRTSMSILSTIVTSNRSLLEDVKRKGLQLYDLATALKQNKVHEAVTLIYLINPSPLEIKTLELLPCLVEVVCSYYKMDLNLASIMPTPPAASLMIIEVLVTAFDCETNNLHLSEISSRRVISRLVKIPRKDNLEEFISLAAVLVECMRFDGNCRRYIYEFSEVGNFVSLLWSNEKRATNVALEFFNELSKMPRSSSIGLLEEIRKQGSVNNMCALFLLTQNSEPEYRLLAANLLLQLEVLEDTFAKCMYREEAANALLESLACDESSSTQALSAFILSNLGGTYSWTGEPYTTAWLVKKTVLPSANHMNLIKNYDFLDQSMQDGGIDLWCSKIGQRMLQIGEPVFRALEKGLNCKSKRVSRDCLIAISWLGCEIVKSSDEVRNSACEIVLHSIEQFVHPGFELEERLLACLCIYNYTSGRGMKRIISLSEGVRESLRRLSNVTWMAEELLKVADYYQPNKWRISCVHSQILEAGSKCNGAVTALIYYKGLLCSGYTDGSIKVWDIKGQRATLIQEIKEHKKTVTCFALYEHGNCLLSGSSDKTIKMWQMIQKNFECIEVITTKESIRSIDSWGESVFATTQSNKLKVVDGSRKAKDVFKNKRVKCLNVTQGKVYAGCTDSSIQELMIINNRHQEMKPPTKSWMQNKPINSVSVYKDWLYSASLTVDGSKIKDWRRGNKPQISIMPERGASVLAMEVVEDFIYLNCSTSSSSIQIWLRGTQQRVGRLSGGSKITSMLTANDMILCGTEKGVIKGWIPL